MKLIKTNQELIVGKKYLCRDKPRNYFNGNPAPQKIEINEVFMYDERRYVGKNKFWAFDAKDRILSLKGKERIKNVAIETKSINIEILDSDYEVNSQALERWDIIGPVPEIKEDILHALFDYPDLLKYFDKPVSVHPDGCVAIMVKDGDNFEDEVWELISDKETAGELAVLYGEVKEISWNEIELENIPGSFPLIPSAEHYVAPDGLSGTNNGSPSFKNLEEHLFAADCDETGFVTTDSCGSKIGKLVRLTEKKHNQFGYYNEGGILIISAHDVDSGYRAGIQYGETVNNITSFRNEVNIGYDGFEFIDL